jgi:hypothetical protein
VADMVPPNDSFGRFPASFDRRDNKTGVVWQNLTYESFCGRHTPSSSNDFQYASSTVEDSSQNKPSAMPLIDCHFSSSTSKNFSSPMAASSEKLSDPMLDETRT